MRRLSRHTVVRTARGQAGLSLVELMISITIGLVLVAGITSLISQQSGTSSELDKASRQIENGRYAMEQLQGDMALAGYYGEFSKLGTAPAALPNACSTTVADLDAAMPLFAQGYDAPATVPSDLSDCLNDADHVPGTDILVVRHADTTPVAPASATASQIYIQTTQAAYVLGTGSDTSVFTLKKKDGTTLADLRKFVVSIYYVSPCNVKNGTTCSSASDGGKPIPTLKRLDLGLSGSGAGATAGFVESALAEGIENLQIDYGVDNNEDGAPDTYTTAPAATDWANVMTARVSILARNTETSPGQRDGKTYDLGLAGSVGPFNDGYKRHVFTQVIRFVNPSGRREK